MDLPLLKHIQEGNYPFSNDAATAMADPAEHSFCGWNDAAVVPPLPKPGQQYRFHFDMTKCIGCKCCVVACNEQNGNPADILWRRVGEIEGGTYPATHRHYLSMGCNHCVEPTCLKGCPVNAYSKDSLTGIVRHSADACIGCQYCTWNCSYGVPQYNPERGVVGKCDMCYGRLMEGQSPACVSACPEGAIRIEVVNVEEWRQSYDMHANSPGMPSADDSLSTTRITLPRRLPQDVRKVDLSHLNKEDAHWPLIVMTVLTQLSVGAFTSIWLLQMSGSIHRAAVWVALLIAFVALAASTLHLGRPIYAVRALKMWRRSWLSREVLLFTLFAHAAAAYSVTLWLQFSIARVLGAATVLLGIAGVAASARLYLAPGRPAWNSPFTFLEFLGTAALLGSAGATVLTGGASAAHKAVLVSLAITLCSSVLKLIWLRSSSLHELRGTSQLLVGILQNHLIFRFLLLFSGVALSLFSTELWAAVASMLCFVAGEAFSRYLFFVSVVPTNMATEYLSAEAA